MPDTVVLHTSNYRKLTNELEASVTRDQGGRATAGFRGVTIEFLTGPLRVIPSPFCQTDVLWILQSDTWMLISMRDLIHIIDKDGLRVRARDTADSFETRIGSWANLACSKPGHNCRVSL